MKAHELMIGDWVHVEVHRGFNAQNVKVETIPDNDGDNEYGHHYGHIGAWLEGGDNDFRDVETRHLQPIPLTGEILAKNGLKERSWYWEYRDNYCRVKVYIAPKIEIEGELFDEPPILLQVDGATFNLSIIIEYVHELQHALKLCGIEKEITI